MREIFAVLTEALHGSIPLAMVGSFVWGILSIVLSPCHLSSIPLIIAYVDQQGRITTRRAFYISSVFALGILVTIAAIGLITAAAGRMTGDMGPAVNYAVAVIFFLLGLHFLDVIPIPWTKPGPTGTRHRGFLAAFILGLIFGVGVGPCTFAFMAPMLGVSFKVAASNWLYGLLLLFLYGLGHSLVIILAGTFTERVQHYLNWNEKSRGTAIVRRVCGVLIILGGLYLIYTAS